MSGGALRFGELRIDTNNYTVALGERRLNLTPLEFDLLQAMAGGAGVLVTYATLTERVFRGAPPHGSTALRVHLTHLRRKLGPAASAVVTVRGRGLLFEPERLNRGASPGHASGLSRSAAIAASAGDPW